MQLLAETARPDFMISGNWLIGALLLLIPVIGGVWIKAKAAGRSEGETSRQVTLKKPVPTVVTREEPAWATKPDLEDHEERTKQEFAQLWEAIDGERKIARDALGRIHGRLDKQSEATAKVQGTVDEVKSNVSKLLDIALQRKPPGTR